MANTHIRHRLHIIWTTLYANKIEIAVGQFACDSNRRTKIIVDLLTIGGTMHTEEISKEKERMREGWPLVGSKRAIERQNVTFYSCMSFCVSGKKVKR